MENVIIIGSGPAGYTAAIYLSRANLNPVMVMGALPGGLLTQTTEVENFPAFPDGIQGYDLMEKMRLQAEKFSTRFLFNLVEAVDFSRPGAHRLTLDNGENLTAKAVVIAVGAKPRTLGLPGEDELQAHGVSYCATCDGPFYRGKAVAVIGGGDSALEEALFLCHFASEVHVIHRRDSFRASKIMAQRALDNPKIQVHWDSVATAINGSRQTKVSSLSLRNVKTNAEQELPCSGVFIAVGHIPNTAIFEQQLEMTNGYINLVDSGRSLTSVPGVFAAGDCADAQYRQAITAAGMGCRAAIDAERYLGELG